MLTCGQAAPSISSLKVAFDSKVVVGEDADLSCRILRIQSCTHARQAGLVWSTLEGILFFGLEIHDIRSLCPMHGDSDCCMLIIATLKYDESPRANCIGLLGTAFLLGCRLDCHRQ